MIRWVVVKRRVQCHVRFTRQKEGTSLMGLQQGADVGQKRPRILIRGIVSHNGHDIILNGTLQNQVPTAWVCYLFTANKWDRFAYGDQDTPLFSRGISQVNMLVFRRKIFGTGGG